MKKPVGYLFLDSFDPFHSVHHSMVIQVLRESETLDVLIAPLSRKISTEEFLTLEQKVELIEKNYKNYKNIRVLKDSFSESEEFIERYSAQYDLIVVVAPQLMKHISESKNYQELSNKVLRFLVISPTETSSGEIRENLKSLYGKVSVDVYNHFLTNFIEYKKPSLTGDAIVQRKDGKILVFERNTHPYRGCIVFPGGFVDENEHPQETAIRELSEEVGIAISAGTKINYVDTFYKSGRDPRGWVVTNTYLVQLDFNPEGKETAEAKKIQWLSVSELLKVDMGFDHKEALSLAIAKNLIKL